MFTFTFTAGSALIGTLTGIVDAAGQPTTFKAPPVWTSSDPTAFVPTVAADGLSMTGTVLKETTFTLTVVGDGITETAAVTAPAGTVVAFVIQLALAPPPPPPGLAAVKTS